MIASPFRKSSVLKLVLLANRVSSLRRIGWRDQSAVGFSAMASKYWVVSPNVKDNSDTVEESKKASLREQAAFMGYDSDFYHGRNHIGPPFAGITKQGIMPNHFILIAMREDCEKGFFVSFDYSSDALQEIESFFKRSHKVVAALTVQEMLDEHIAKKLV